MQKLLRNVQKWQQIKRNHMKTWGKCHYRNSKMQKLKMQKDLGKPQKNGQKKCEEPQKNAKKLICIFWNVLNMCTKQQQNTKICTVNPPVFFLWTCCRKQNFFLWKMWTEQKKDANVSRMWTEFFEKWRGLQITSLHYSYIIAECNLLDGIWRTKAKRTPPRTHENGLQHPKCNDGQCNAMTRTNATLFAHTWANKVCTNDTPMSRALACDTN